MFCFLVIDDFSEPLYNSDSAGEIRDSVMSHRTRDISVEEFAKSKKNKASGKEMQQNGSSTTGALTI